MRDLSFSDVSAVGMQFVKRMGVRTHKPFVMCRPRAVSMCDCSPEEALPRFVPATVRDLVDLGPKQKARLQFDDGQVRARSSPCGKPCDFMWLAMMPVVARHGQAMVIQH